VITRIAPTPSGYLHLGNAVNFQVVSWAAKRAAGSVALRIDDMDAERYRPEFVDDIFAVLGWLGIEWHAGPIDRADFERHYSFRTRHEYFRAELDRLLALGPDAPVYACSCSRSALRAAGSRGCVSDCWQGGRALVPGQAALRARVPVDACVVVDGRPVAVAHAMGDVVLWRRDDHPAYHFASVIQDRDLDVTDVIRGADLRDSTAVQRWLAPFIGADNVARATFRHHQLVTDEHGAKLSKSRLASGPLERTAPARAEVRRVARSIALDLGIEPD
jgi:glutamyl-tRNA synthetase